MTRKPPIFDTHTNYQYLTFTFDVNDSCRWTHGVEPKVSALSLSSQHCSLENFPPIKSPLTTNTRDHNRHYWYQLWISYLGSLNINVNLNMLECLYRKALSNVDESMHNAERRSHRHSNDINLSSTGNRSNQTLLKRKITI